MNKKIIGGIALVGVLAVGGFVAFNPSKTTTQPTSDPKYVSQVKTEELALLGTITSIEPDENGITATIKSDSSSSKYEKAHVFAHASTNIWNLQDELIEPNNLTVGQRVEVYYSGTEMEDRPGTISAMSINIIE